MKLLQQKNLFNEFYGRKYIKVGEIELRVGYNMRVDRNLVDDADYFLRKMATEVEEGHEVIGIMDREMATLELITDESRSFLTNIFGNPGWERLVQARWLKKRQINHDNEFDPNKEDVPKIYVKDGVEFKPKHLPEEQEDHKVDLESGPEVEDPQGVLSDGELEASGIPKKRVPLTQVVLEEKK